MIPTLLAAALAAVAAGSTGPGAAPAAADLHPAAAPLRLQQGWDEQQWDDEQYQEEERHPHLLLSVWGGEAFASGGSGRSSGFFAAEADWVFSGLDVGLQGARYRSLRESTRLWTPVILTRVTQRFRTGRGVEAAFTLGLGAGRPAGWIAWYQVAIGMRVPLGPVFLAGELAFEQYDILRLGGGLGVAF